MTEKSPSSTKDMLMSGYFYRCKIGRKMQALREGVCDFPVNEGDGFLSTDWYLNFLGAISATIIFLKEK